MCTFIIDRQQSECPCGIVIKDSRCGNRKASRIQHSPSFRTQSKGCGEMLDLGRWERLCQRISNHVVGGAIYEAKGSFFDNPADKVVAHINVLRA